jgi:hypothetical protein
MTLPTPAIAIAFSAAPWETATEEARTDISAYVRSVNVRRGRNSALGQMEAGICDIVLDNRTGAFWPTNTTGPYAGNIKPGKQVYVRFTYDTTIYGIYHGWAAQWQPSFLAMGDPGFPVVTLRCEDLLSDLAILEINTGTAYPAQRSDLRIQEILTDINWTHSSDLKTGEATIPTTTATTLNALSHIRAVEEAEQGYFFQSRLPLHANWHGRYSRLVVPYNEVQATYGDGAGDLPVSDIEFDYGREDIYNDVRITRAGGTEQTASDGPSQSAYRVRSYVRTGVLLNGDVAADALADYILARHKDPHMRVRSITINPMDDPGNLWVDVLTYDIGTRIAVRAKQAELYEQYHIEGIEHDIAPGRWLTKWWLSSASAQGAWILGTSQLGYDTVLAG